MGTKSNPGKYDCYEKAKPDEPMFTLLARDPLAPALVRLWVEMKQVLGCEDGDKLTEAINCSLQMETWRRGK